MPQIKAIIFDFDGVIVDSLDVKVQAFLKFYAPYGNEIVEKVKQDYEFSGGISRLKKFKQYHKQFLNQDLSEGEIEKLGQAYSEIVVQQVIASAYIEGVYPFLEKNYSLYSFFVSTGTPENEAKEIIEKRGINRFFKKIYGSPTSKVEHIEHIIKHFALNRTEILFIGDSPIDRDSADDCNVKFIARLNGNNFLTSEKYKINDFINFEQFMQTHFS